MSLCKGNKFAFLSGNMNCFLRPLTYTHSLAISVYQPDLPECDIYPLVFNVIQNTLADPKGRQGVRTPLENHKCDRFP